MKEISWKSRILSPENSQVIHWLILRYVFYKHTKSIEYVRILYGWITREFLGLRRRNFRDIIFIWIPTYGEIFRSALVYLWGTPIYKFARPFNHTILSDHVTAKSLHFLYHNVCSHQFCQGSVKLLEARTQKVTWPFIMQSCEIM